MAAPTPPKPPPRSSSCPYRSPPIPFPAAIPIPSCGSNGNIAEGGAAGGAAGGDEDKPMVPEQETSPSTTHTTVPASPSSDEELNAPVQESGEGDTKCGGKDGAPDKQ
ncbi:F-box/LRR-repeat protein 17-like isoform X2 [Tachysurus fulvidraco]|uniref:F-box/LRR-repeat protein 17-like isoform X2 n=1 Tax=Tachysurus fulvidraco TaxID=1234273 RepID=UPI001FED8814|nr:F-box/LRR-repeat protein 17-like isoform X2 [Tachysurus fulvidraco]XP_047659071.1 F-box/LRR-repeat protein 17-like isoform X2 [Tachysurus fulvidraco]